MGLFTSKVDTEAELIRLPNSRQKQKQRVSEGQRRREEASSREKAAASPGGAATKRQRRIQAAPSPSGVDSRSAESTQRRHQAAAPSKGAAKTSLRRRRRIMSAPRLTQAAPSPSSADSRRRHRVKALPRPGGGTERLLATLEEEGAGGRGAGEGESPRAGLRRAPKEGEGPSLGRRPTPVRSPPRRGPALRREQGLSRPGYRYPGPQTAPKATPLAAARNGLRTPTSVRRPAPKTRERAILLFLASCPGPPGYFWAELARRLLLGTGQRGVPAPAAFPAGFGLSLPDLGGRRRADGTARLVRGCCGLFAAPSATGGPALLFRGTLPHGKARAQPAHPQPEMRR